MCGIIGYIGDRDTTSILLVGLERLSYRGYDSSGISILSKGELSSWKKAGKINELGKLLSGMTINAQIGIGHTRWATHGIANDINSHPHNNRNNKVSVVHNGIIENYLEIKKSLIDEGYIFRSETDTEVIVHLIEKHLNGSLRHAVIKALETVTGSYAIAVIAENNPDKIIIAKKGSPILIGCGENENFISSDMNALLPHTQNIIYLEDNQIGEITKEKITLYNTNDKEIEKKVHTINWNPSSAGKEGYEHFMIKEIYEQPTVIRNILSKYISNKNEIEFNKLNGFNLETISRFLIQACGTSCHAGMIAKYYIEKYARILTEVDISSEFRYRQMIAHGNDVILAISQSGETADTLAGIHEAKSHFFRILSFVNVKNSSIDRESDAVIYSHSGQEVGVASTKNFIAQLTTLYLFTIHLAETRKKISAEQASTMLSRLNKIPNFIEQILAQTEKIKEIADKYYLSNQFIFIGRGMNYPSALEGALKLKEISYIHATGYAAGELKHGPIALIDPKLPVVCIAPNSPTYEKMFSNIQEVKSRKGKTIIIATEGNKEIKKYADDIIYIPDVHEDLTPILAAIPLQLLSYYISIKLDCNVDQPRNLAKSVTVE